MNDRIDVLALQATDSKGGLDRQKFAELIVRMCADAADMYEGKSDCVGDCVAEYMGYGQEEGITEWRAK